MTVDQKKLTGYCLKYPNFESILGLLAPPAAKNNRKVTYIDNIEAKLVKGGIEMSRSEIVAVFRLLDSAGCGTCIRGINGRRTRMEWAVEHTSLAGLAKAKIRDAKKRRNEVKNGTIGFVVKDVIPTPQENKKQGSLKNLDLICSGMTHQEVVTLLGCEGGVPSWNQPKEPGHKTYAWGDDRSRWVYFVTVDQDALVIKVSMTSID
jgi:hypothetical protein